MADNRIRKFTLTLKMDIPLHAEAYAALQKIPKGKRALFVCRRITDDGNKDALSPGIREAIYESVKRAFREQGPLQPQQAANEISEPLQQADEAGEAKRNFLGFLAALQQDEGEDDD
ncbi:MAG: hypothetical protein IJO10_02855 [Clostridia bacterium]|nr:hypothetical protein [Clostridia bacterium]